MAKWAASGGAVEILVVTSNCSGELLRPDGSAYRLPAAETSALRHAEQAAAAALIGARVTHLGYPQRHYFDGAAVRRLGFGDAVPPPDPASALPPLLVAYQLPEHVARMAGVLSGLAPSLILCQPPSDCDPEHHATAALVWAAWRAAEPLADVPLRFYSPGSSAPGGLFRIHYDVLEDVSDHFETKLALCAAFASQMTEPRWRMVRERAAAFGTERGVRFAEPFVSALRGE